MDKVFLLGVGCQKGGTTWLHRYLNRHPEVNLGFRKEYHVFDALTIDYFRKVLEKHERKLSKLRRRKWKKNKNKKFARKLKNFERQDSFYESVENYFNYFDELAKGKADIKVVGDITPSYAGLSLDVLSEIRKNLLARGFTIRVVFLMRDPVERVISSVRMNRRNSIKAKREVGQSEELDILLHYKRPEVELRTRYENTITNLRSVFAEEELIFEFFENLFNEPAIRNITNRLGIVYQEPHFDMYFNKSKTDQVISEDTRKTVAQYYAQTYQFVEETFPSFPIRELWKSNSLLTELHQ